MNSKTTQGEEKYVGTEQGKRDLGAASGWKWEQGGPCMGSQPPKPRDTTLLAQAQEFVSVPEGPRALLGHSSKKAAEESGVGCNI